MIRCRILSFLCALGLVSRPSIGQAQVTTSACRAASETAGNLLVTIRLYAIDSAYAGDAAFLKIPRVPATAMHVVSEPLLCRAAVDAYRKVCGRPEGTSGRVQVVRAGDVYVVLDPDFGYNPT